MGTALMSDGSTRRVPGVSSGALYRRSTPRTSSSVASGTLPGRVTMEARAGETDPTLYRTGMAGRAARPPRTLRRLRLMPSARSASLCCDLRLMMFTHVSSFAVRKGRNRDGKGLPGYDLSHRRFDDGNVLLRCSTADSDTSDHPVLARERHAAAHRGVSTAGDGEEGIELRAWLHERDEVSGAHADERGRVGLSLGEIDGECRRSGHAVDENNVAVDVDDGDRDRYVLFHRLGLDAVSDFLRGDE